MPRWSVEVRDASIDDVDFLLDLWAEFARRPTTGADVTEEATRAVARIAADPDERLLLAQVNGVPAGAVHVRRATTSAIHLDPALHVSHLMVTPSMRRCGVGNALMAQVVAWAEEKDVAHLVAASAGDSRDSNRFMARLGLAQVAVVRMGATGSVRSKLGLGRGQVGQVLAHRRTLRRRLANNA